MDSSYTKWYEEFKQSAELFDDDELFESLDSLLHSSKNTFAMNRKLMAKAIDVTWVEAIENGLIHVDNVLRNPRRTIEDVEEVVPIALSRKITVESVKHLAQHTDLIQSIDKKTGKITPSKILNIHKEESLMTYENKFINTLVDRLYIFINTRYEKLAQIAKDEEVYTLGYDTFVDDGAGGKMKIEVKLESTSSLESYNAGGYTVWQRVEKLKKAIEGYKGSELCTTLGNTYIRPPVMRTNAIMKNVDLKACLTLWQYIESYDKTGYAINVEDTAVKPDNVYIEDFYRLVILNLLLFRSYTDQEGVKLPELKTHKPRTVAPKFVKRFSSELSEDYDVVAEGIAGYVATDGEFKVKKNLPKDISKVFEEVNKVIEIEKAYLAEREAERIKAEELRLEEQKRLEEQRRIEEARREELERIRIKKEEEEKALQEMLAKKRAEQEAQERELQRLEAERQARLEEQRKREEEERLRREEEERIAAERERISRNKSNMRAELGEAEGVEVKEETEEELEKKAYEEVTEAEVEQVKAELEEKKDESEQAEEAQFEDPRAVAARQRLEQQRKEKERRETERAQRLKAERQYFESKPFWDIYKEYSKNPIYAIPRFIRYILAMVFGIIPENTDNPAFKQKRAEIEAKKRAKEEEKQKHDAMEVYYKKYAQTFKYRFMRRISDYKFKKRKRQQMKGKPKPVFVPPNRTPEEQRAIDLEMKRLYKEYHVSAYEKMRRKVETIRRENSESKRNKEIERMRNVVKNGGDDNASAAEAEAKKIQREFNANKVANIIVAVITAGAIAFTAYVMACAARGKAVEIFGKCVLRVVTGSMEPSLHVGDHIIVERVDTDELKEGDIISFYSEQSDIYGMLVTHRITEVNEDGTFTTKGDANTAQDTPVRAERIVGRYTGKARFFNWVGTFGDARKLLMVFVIIPIAIISVLELRSLTKLGKELSDSNRLSKEEKREQYIREAIEREKQRLAEENYQAEEEVKPDEPREDNEEEDD